MAIFRVLNGREQDVEAQFVQVYKALPLPKNNEQFALLLGLIKGENEQLFAYARFTQCIKLVPKILLLMIIAIVVLRHDTTDIDVLKGVLKYLISFVR